MQSDLDQDALAANPRRVTSVAIAAETIGEGCGLGNYLACLRSALEAERGESRQLRAFGTVGDSFAHRGLLGHLRTAIGTSKLGSLLRPVYRRVVRASPHLPATSWAEIWRALDASTVCLLPHVVCNDGGLLDEYYSALATRRLVWVVHDLHPLHFPDQWDSRSVDLFVHRCRMLADCARAIIVHNEYTKADVCQRLGAAPTKVVVAGLPSILPQCEAQVLPPAGKTLRKLGIRRPYALWASSSTFGHKNHDRLLRAWRKLRDQSKEIQLVCTGSQGPRWATLERLIRDLGLQDSVVFTGGVPREVMWVVLGNATIAVCPTLFEGGGSGPVAEAIMMRVPVACARIPQIQEQLDYRDDLVEWFDPLDEQAIAEAVGALLDDPGAALSRAKHAAEVYPTLRSWAQVADVYWHALDAAARGEPRRGEDCLAPCP